MDLLEQMKIRISMEALNEANRKEHQMPLDIEKLKTDVRVLNKVVKAILGVLSEEQLSKIKDTLGVESQ
ncbi:MAG: hypothetical protein ICV66_00930 [Chitinophagaceae bacterium]|nr:hypothetical protein [Chitinophagaceae bacterium]